MAKERGFNGRKLLRENARRDAYAAAQFGLANPGSTASATKAHAAANGSTSG